MGWGRLIIVVLGVGLGLSSPPLRAEPTIAIPNRYIIQRNSTAISALSAEEISYTTVKGSENFDVVVPDRYLAHAASHSRRGGEVLNLDKVAQDCAEILKDPTVSSCEPDVWEGVFLAPNDPSFNLQWHLHDAATDGDIEAPSAWDSTTGSSDTLIGVLDSGVYIGHPDLSPNLWSNANEPVDGVDNDANGYIDDVHGVNTALNTGSPEDLDGHGSHVSGILAARGNNSAGVSGVMWTASLVVVSAASDNSGIFARSDVIQGFDYFHSLKNAGHNIRIINASLGSSTYSSGMYDAIARLNAVDVLVVAAAGNASRNNDSLPTYPANYDLPNIISVGATGQTKELASYSNYGNSVDIAAPGGDSAVGGTAGQIYSTYSNLVSGGSDYKYLQGTSMAAPVVTGALGLLAASRPALTGAELKSLLLSSADSLSQLNSSINSGRFINLGAMLSSAGSSDGCPDDPAKSAPGVCGCGVADTDTDADGSADCLDSCPSDIGKTGAGVCGCGVSDADANNNSTPDCNDPVLAGVVPRVAKLSTKKGKVVVSMESRSGVLYLLKVTTKSGKAKATTAYYSASSPSYTIRRLKAKTSVSVSYSFYLTGTPVVASSYSPVKKIVSK